MISASLNRCKGMEDQVGDFLKHLAAKLERVLLIHTKELRQKNVASSENKKRKKLYESYHVTQQ